MNLVDFVERSKKQLQWRQRCLSKYLIDISDLRRACERDCRDLTSESVFALKTGVVSAIGKGGGPKSSDLAGDNTAMIIAAVTQVPLPSQVLVVAVAAIKKNFQKQKKKRASKNLRHTLRDVRHPWVSHLNVSISRAVDTCLN